MFSFISWPLFLTALALLAVGYYLITSILLYHREIKHYLQSLNASSTAPPAENQNHQSLHDNLMGIANDTPSASQYTITVEPSPEDFITTGSNDEADFIRDEPHSSDMIIGSIADLLEEIKKQALVIAENRTGKTETKALFNALFISYPLLHNTPYSQAINFFLLKEAADNFSFELSADELQSWWLPTTEPANSNHSIS